MKKIICLGAFLMAGLFAFSQDVHDSLKRKIVDNEIGRSGIRPTITNGEEEAILDTLKAPLNNVMPYILKVKSFCNGPMGTGERMVVVKNEGGVYTIGHVNEQVPYSGVRYAYWDIVVRHNIALVIVKGAPSQRIKWIHSKREIK